MTDEKIPTPETLWSLLQEQQEQLAAERTRIAALEERLTRLQQQAPRRGRTEHRVSRAGMLGAAVAGVAGVALSQGQAFAQTAPPPIPSFTPFPSPHRVFGDGTLLPAGTTTAAIDATAGGVPAGAGAAYCAVQATNPGVMTLFPDGSPDPGIANWANTGAAGQLALFYMLVPLSAAGKFKIHTYFTGSVYVDVWGYLY
ncbi:MAG: hypothetical protein NVS4B2_27490 [Chloroflexota bacterium]